MGRPLVCAAAALVSSTSAKRIPAIFIVTLPAFPRQRSPRRRQAGRSARGKASTRCNRGNRAPLRDRNAIEAGAPHARRRSIPRYGLAARSFQPDPAVLSPHIPRPPPRPTEWPVNRYSPQNATIAFCSALMLENPSAVAAALSPPYCRTTAATLWPLQFAFPGVPANVGGG